MYVCMYVCMCGNEKNKINNENESQYENRPTFSTFHKIQRPLQL